MAAAVMAHPLEPRDRDRRVYNPTVVDKGFSAPLASVESLSDIVREAGAGLGRPSPRSFREPSSGTDSGRWSPSTILEVTDPSLSDGSGGGASSGIDTASLSGAAAPLGAPHAMDGEDAEAETLPSLGWPPGPADSPGGGLGGHEVDGCWDRAVKPAVDEPINLAFHKLSYTVYSRLRLRWEKRRILHGISGEFKAGQLTAIMGPSGAGKSTLLDVMSGYTSSGVHGRLLVNGTPRDSRTFRRQSVYIQQDASLHPQLTVSEAMNVASVLKLGRRGPEIDEVLYSLGLLEHRDTMTSRLSGGQLKRLATALELLSNPPVMFFDEPTSGLDSSTTKQCVGVLRRLARQGRTVVCTIHQPSATVFEMLDQLYLVVGGRCAYSGHTANLLPYLAGLGLRCPPYHNPADYALEVAGGEYGDFSEELVKASDNGRCVMWTTTYTAQQQAAETDQLRGLLAVRAGAGALQQEQAHLPDHLLAPAVRPPQEDLPQGPARPDAVPLPPLHPPGGRAAHRRALPRHRRRRGARLPQLQPPLLLPHVPHVHRAVRHDPGLPAGDADHRPGALQPVVLAQVVLPGRDDGRRAAAGGVRVRVHGRGVLHDGPAHGAAALPPVPPHLRPGLLRGAERGAARGRRHEGGARRHLRPARHPALHHLLRVLRDPARRARQDAVAVRGVLPQVRPVRLHAGRVRLRPRAAGALLRRLLPLQAAGQVPPRAGPGRRQLLAGRRHPVPHRLGPQAVGVLCAQVPAQALPPVRRVVLCSA